MRSMSPLAVVLALFAACSESASPGSDPSGDGSDGGGPVGNGTRDASSEAVASREGGANSPGCRAAPAESFDPLAGYLAPPFAPTAQVTTLADSGPGSLRAAVAGGGVVGFAPALAGQTIKLASTLELVGSVTIDGSAAPGITVDAAQSGGAIHFNGDAPTKLRFFALRMKNGKTTGSGGAISVNGVAVDVEIGGVRFESNSAGEGGAIRVGYRSPNVFVHDSLFVRNDGSLTNNGFSGGAISVSGGHLHVARCRFESNTGSTSGAVYGIHANPVIEDSVFVDNRASGTLGSGAFFADGGGPGDYGNGDKTPGEITLRRSLFVRNRGAGDDGGAGELYAYPPDTVTVEACAFRANESNPGRAGALFIHADGAVNVKQSSFLDNHATTPGGAIWADGAGAYTFENDLFSGNATDSDLGGALRLNLDAKARLRIASSTFVGNRATSGNGALWLPGPRDARVRNSIFANNTVVGAAQQINFPVTDEGGNIEWPAPAGKPTLAVARNVDPALGPPALDQGSWVRPIASSSPARDAATGPAPAVDQRGAVRGARPDIGSFELGAVCSSP